MKNGIDLFVLVFFIGVFSMINFSGCKKKDLPPAADPYVYVPVPPQNLNPVYPISMGNGWELIAKIGNGTLTDLMFKDELNGYAISGNSTGNLFKTIDGGKIWKSIVVPSEFKNHIFNNIFLIGNKIFITPYSQLYLLEITADTLFKKIPFDEGIYDIQFVNIDTGYAVGKKNLFWTTDGGNKWNKLLSTSNSRDGFNALYFNPENKGMVILDSLYAIDTRSRKIVALSPVYGNNFASIQFFGDKYIFITNSSYLLRSSDGGKNFIQKVPIFPEHYSDLYIPSFSKGVMGNNNRVDFSIDTGKTWTRSLVVEDGTIIEIDFLNHNLGWACSSNGKIYKYKK